LAAVERANAVFTWGKPPQARSPKGSPRRDAPNRGTQHLARASEEPA
jgi:hypothetical protein